MFWIAKLHFANLSSTQTQAFDDGKFKTHKEVAKAAIEGYGYGDIDHVEVIGIQEKDMRDWHSFDVTTVIE